MSKNNRARQHIIPAGTINTSDFGKVNTALPKDFYAWFLEVFDNPSGKRVLEHLDKYSHRNFPNYDNVNATFSKIGEQTLVEYIKSVLVLAKKGGGNTARAAANKAMERIVKKR